MSENPPSAEYLAESQATLLNIFFALPIPLEILSTSLRLWVKLTKTSGRRLAFDDYLMICATVRDLSLLSWSVSGRVTAPPVQLTGRGGLHI